MVGWVPLLPGASRCRPRSRHACDRHATRMLSWSSILSDAALSAALAGAALVGLSCQTTRPAAGPLGH